MKPVRKNWTVARAEQSRHCRITNSVNSGDTRVPGKPAPDVSQDERVVSMG